MFDNRGDVAPPLDVHPDGETPLDELLLLDPLDPEEERQYQAWRTRVEPDPPDDLPEDDASGLVPAAVTARLRALVAAPPGPEVLASVVALEAAGLSPHDEVLALQVYERATSWLAARTARALVAVVPEPAPGRVGGHLAKDQLEAQIAYESARLEAACALRLSTGEARWRITAAHLLHDAPRTLVALGTGAISPAHARVICDGLAPLANEPALRDAVEAGAVTTASTSTVRATRDALARLVLAANPGAAETRRKEAVRERAVTLGPLPDGMAELYARLPAADALDAYAALTEAADRARLPGDERTAGQRRADTLVDLLIRSRPDIAPLGDATPAAQPVASAAGATPMPTPSSRPAHTAAAPTAATAGDTAGDSAAHPGGPSPAPRRSRYRDRRRRSIGVVVAATTLAGADEQPGHLAGYGPITAEAARELTADGELRRLLVDPVSGRLLDLGRTRYRPPDDLQDHIRERDRTCTAPGCSTDAAHTEVDHDTKWDDGGPTRHDKLWCRCGTHHRAKDHGGWITSTDPDGTGSWTSPCGHTYTVTPEGHVHFLPLTSPEPGSPDPRHLSRCHPARRHPTRGTPRKPSRSERGPPTLPP